MFWKFIAFGCLNFFDLVIPQRKPGFLAKSKKIISRNLMVCIKRNKTLSICRENPCSKCCFRGAAIGHLKKRTLQCCVSLGRSTLLLGMIAFAEAGAVVKVLF